MGNKHDHQAKRFEVQENWDSSWNLNCVADNGEPLGEPSYSSKAAVLKAIDAYRRMADAPVKFLPKQKAPAVEEDSPSEAMP